MARSAARGRRLRACLRRAQWQPVAQRIGYADVEVEGQELASGRYALYTIPGARTWTVILSRNTELFMAAVSGAAPEDWGAPWRAAMALRDVGQRRDLVDTWIEASLEIERNWMNLGTAAELAAEAGDIEAAVTLGEEAVMKCGAATPYCPYAAAWATQLDLWRQQLGTP